MKRTIHVTGICVVGLVVFSSLVCAQGAWVNSEGCYCGRHPWPPVTVEVKGSGTSLERAETLAQMDYWNRYTNIFDPCVESGMGAPNNGKNEIMTFATPAQAWNTYKVAFDSNDYGITLFYPSSAFGVFNQCRDYTSIGCGNFTETDILINSSFGGGWTTDPLDFSKALVQATALHEIGHLWGAHHVFSLPSGNSYSCMNYMNDYGIRYVTRMDANTIRYAYSSKERSVADIGIYPLSYGNDSYAETYGSATPSTVAAGNSLNIGPYTVQNCGTSNQTNVRVTFYLSTDTVITSSDISIGYVGWDSPSYLNKNQQWTESRPYTVPGSVGQGYYYVGAIVTVWGNEDTVKQNNRMLFVNGGTGSPTSPRRVKVTNWFDQSPISPAATPKPTAVPQCEDICTSWCDDNYLELTVSPTSISSGQTLKLNYDCSFSDANFYNVPVNVYLALIKDPTVTDQPCSTGQALAGGTVYMWENRMRSNYIWRGRLGDPTWSWVQFPASISSSGSLNITLTAPPGRYIWAGAFIESATGRFVRPGTEVEASNTFTIK